MSKFNRDHLAFVLYTAPRIVNEENLELISTDVEKAFGWMSSDSPDGVNMYSNIKYGFYSDPPKHPRRFGLQLRDEPIFLSDLFEDFAKVGIPAEVKNRWEISEDEWHSAISVVTLILKSLESSGTSKSGRDPMRVFHRSLTYKLYATSQIINEAILPLVKQSLLDEIQEHQDYIDYDVSINRWGNEEYKVFGFKTRMSHISLKELLYYTWGLSSELEKKYPILAKQGHKRNFPDWWKPLYAQSIEDWNQDVHPTVDNLWSAVNFAVALIMSIFQKTESINWLDLPYEVRVDSNTEQE